MTRLANLAELLGPHAFGLSGGAYITAGRRGGLAD